MEISGLFHTLAAGKQFCNATSFPEQLGFPAKAQRIMGVVGPSVEEDKVALTASISSAYQLTQIATRSTRDTLSCVLHNSDACAAEHRYLFRAGSSDTYQAYAIADLIKHFNWTHFAVVSAPDLGSTTLLAMFRKRSEEYGFCPAFVSTIETKQDALRIDGLLRRHRRAKVLVVFGGSTEVKLLADTILEQSDKLGQDLPRIWVGNDKWGYTRGFMFSKDKLRYRRTMQAVLGLGKRTPTRLSGWEWPLISQSYIKEFSDFILNVTAGDIRKDPYLTSNPFLCHIMEKANGCSGVCPQPTEFGHMRRCSNDTRIPETTSSGEHQSEMVEPFTMVATEIFLRSLDKLFHEFVRKFPNLTGESLADEFYKYTYGERLRTAVKTTKVPCSNGKGDCAVFPGKLQEFVPEYHIVAASMKLGKAAWLGFWKADGFRESPTNISMKMDKSLISFGRELFDDDEKSDFPEFVDASERIPTSSCSAPCPPGHGVVISSPKCCHLCVRCPPQQYSPGGLSECRACKIGYQPNSNQTDCHALPVVFMRTAMLVGMFLASATMTVVLVATVSMVIYFRKTPLLRSCDISLTLILLFVMIAGCLSVHTHLITPTTTVCVFVRLLDTFSLLASSTIILVKTSRLARIHFMSKTFKRARLQWTMMLPAQVVFSIVLISAGVAMELALMNTWPVKQKLAYTTEATHRICSNPTPLIAAVDFYLILMILTTVILAFFTRKLPINYNEAHLLFLASFSLCVLWGLLRPMYYLSEEQDRKLPEILLVLMHMASIWLWIFVPRLYAILFRRQRIFRRRSTISAMSFSRTRISVTSRGTAA